MEAKAYWNDGTGRGVFVLGWQFGPMLLADETTCEEALSEFDERFGERIEPGDQSLADYDGASDSERIEAAMDCGDARINDGGTAVWADPYEWIREFASVEAALAEFASYPSFCDAIRSARAPEGV